MKKKIWSWRNVIQKSSEATRSLSPFALSASLCTSSRKRLVTKIAQDSDTGQLEIQANSAAIYMLSFPSSCDWLVAKFSAFYTLVWEIPGDHWYWELWLTIHFVLPWQPHLLSVTHAGMQSNETEFQSHCRGFCNPRTLQYRSNHTRFLKVN